MTTEERDELIFQVMRGAKTALSLPSVDAAVRLLLRIKEHEAFISLLQSGEFVAHRNAEGEDVFYAREHDPAPATELFRLPLPGEHPNPSGLRIVLKDDHGR